MPISKLPQSSLEIDPVQNALVGISVGHHEVHEGEAFHLWHTNMAVTNNQYLTILLETGSKDTHIKLTAAVEGAAIAEIFENCTASGTALTAYNMNRTSMDMCSCSFSAVTSGAAATTASSTTLSQLFIPGGGGPKSVGAIGRTEFEWVLSPSTSYLFRIKNVAGAAKIISGIAEWYEEDG